MVMEETERNLREKIEQEAKNTLKKTMWEGYANDILTGLQKNPGVQPDRPIWELVQNARDVAYENKIISYFNIMVNRLLVQHYNRLFYRQVRRFEKISYKLGNMEQVSLPPINLVWIFVCLVHYHY